MSFYKYLFFFLFIRKENHNLNNVKISNYTSQNEITYLFADSKKNLLIAFHSVFCFGCYDMLQNLKKLSTYEFVQNSSNIIFVNCDRARNLCKDYNVTNFPTIKIFIIFSNY